MRAHEGEDLHSLLHELVGAVHELLSGHDSSIIHQYLDMPEDTLNLLCASIHGVTVRHVHARDQNVFRRDSCCDELCLGRRQCHQTTGSKICNAGHSLVPC